MLLGYLLISSIWMVLIFLLTENNIKSIINVILTNGRLEHGVNEAKAGMNSHMALATLTMQKTRVAESSE